MLPVSHIYNASGQYNVCLIAYNQQGCTDTTCATVTTIVTPVVDVPNAFSPNADGTNDVIYVQGFAISKMTWRIFNRWGQLLFTSSSINNGWDGRFKGALQPQDVYAYTLSIEFSDGTKLNKKGDITLLR
jgi:gliding motility-associated-like protein